MFTVNKKNIFEFFFIVDKLEKRTDCELGMSYQWPHIKARLVHYLLFLSEFNYIQLVQHFCKRLLNYLFNSSTISLH